MTILFKKPPAARAWDDAARMLGVDDARDRILAAFAPLPSVLLPLADALGRVLATDVRTAIDIPLFANSAMDGFAVRAQDTVSALPGAPVELRVIGQAAAGYAPEQVVVAGAAVRIMTGAPIPAGADAVVRFEETDEESRGDGRWIGIRRPAAAGDNIRPAGEDAPAGATVLDRGARLRPGELALLAAIGQTTVEVHRRPRVAILATGDEVVDPGMVPGPGQIRDSNSTLVAALVARCGGEPVVLGVARDVAEDLRARLAAAAGADLIVTIGGVSAGDYDHVKTVLRQDGRIDLWQVRMKPGKPLAFGTLGEIPLIGLPGNPVAAAVAFEQFVRPAVMLMLGRFDLAIPAVPARLVGRVENGGGRRHYVRVRVRSTASGYEATPCRQGAGMLTTLSEASGLLVIPEEMEVAASGAVLPVQMLDWGLG